MNNNDVMIYEDKDGELKEIWTNKKFLLVQKEGKREAKRNIIHYNLDMIINNKDILYI